MPINMLACVAAWLALAGPAAADEAAPKPKVFQIELSLMRGDPLGSPRDGTVEILSRPQVMTTEGQEARVLIGQTVPVAGECLDVGCKFALLPEATASGKIRVRVGAEVSRLVASGEDSATVEANRHLCVREVTPGETVRIRIGPRATTETWLELTAREMKR